MKLLIIGLGLRASMIFTELQKWGEAIEIVGVVDPDREATIARMESIYKSPLRFFDTAEEALDTARPDGVLIGTRCNLHTQNALAVMERNLPMFLEKPVSVTQAELDALALAARRYKSQAVCSFPLRVSPMAELVKEIVQSGKLGTIEQVQAVNNVPYGGVYYHSWYRDDAITHGLWLQKATHDFDYIFDMLGMLPIEVCAMDAKQIFKGDKPAGLACEDCEEYRRCPESPYVLAQHCYEKSQGSLCSFATDTGNQDSGSAILRFATGMHAVYSQNFYIKKAAAKRGARLMGYKGTLEFDWYSGEVKVMMHSVPRVDRYAFDSSVMSHFGGDRALTRNFLDVCAGEKSIAPLSAGLASAQACLCAEQSARTRAFVSIPGI